MEQERYASFEMPVRCGHELEMRHESALKKKGKEGVRHEDVRL